MDQTTPSNQVLLGAPGEDKIVSIEVELHALDQVIEGAQYVFMRIESDDETFFDKYLYPVDDKTTGTVLGTTFTLSKHASAGYWIPTWGQITDEHENERFESRNDFGWQMYLNNPLEDTVAPAYKPNSAALTLSTSTVEGQSVQIVHARWGVIEDIGMRERWACYASMNDELPDTYRLQEYGHYDEDGERCEVLFQMPDYMPSSLYSLDYIGMVDLAGKWSSTEFYEDSPGYAAPVTIRVTTTNPDTDPPELDLNNMQLTATPTNSTSPNGETLVTFTFRVRDNISGFVLGGFYLRDPQGIDHHFYAYNSRRGHLFPEGDPTEWKTYTETILLPAGSAPGTWGIPEMTIWDRAHNFRKYDFTEIIHFVVQ